MKTKLINETPSKQELAELVKKSGNERLDLFITANRLRNENKGDTVFTCAIMNAKSGNCSENCAFCSQSAVHSSGSPVYSILSKEEMIEKGLRYCENDITRFSFVTSGHGATDAEIDDICEASRVIRERTGVRLCASLGIIDRKKGDRLVQSGITRYHHNIETAPSHFSAICTSHSFEERVQTIVDMKNAGLEVCAGGIMGMGETWDQRIEMAYTLKDLDIDSIPLNFLNPIKGTRLESQTPLRAVDALLSIALFRIINPDKDITICGGREPVLRDLQSWVFFAGANGLMVGDYLTVGGRKVSADFDMIKSLELLNEAR